MFDVEQCVFSYKKNKAHQNNHLMGLTNLNLYYVKNESG
jgi:hypothetical protein